MTTAAAGPGVAVVVGIVEAAIVLVPSGVIVGKLAYASVNDFYGSFGKFNRYSSCSEPGGGSGGKNSSREIKNVYDSIKKSPQYPKGFQKVQNGTKKVNVKNGPVLDELRKIELGEWKKIYQNGYVGGQKVSIHYFQHSKTGKVFDVKVKWTWSTGWN